VQAVKGLKQEIDARSSSMAAAASRRTDRNGLVAKLRLLVYPMVLGAPQLAASILAVIARRW
jgi:hypothetical protein